MDSLYTVPAHPIADVSRGAYKMVHNKWADHNLWYENTSRLIYTDSERHDNSGSKYNLFLWNFTFKSIVII